MPTTLGFEASLEASEVKRDSLKPQFGPNGDVSEIAHAKGNRRKRTPVFAASRPLRSYLPILA
jgi:hypothetical protein